MFIKYVVLMSCKNEWRWWWPPPCGRVGFVNVGRRNGKTSPTLPTQGHREGASKGRRQGDGCEMAAARSSHAALTPVSPCSLHELQVNSSGRIMSMPRESGMRPSWERTGGREISAGSRIEVSSSTTTSLTRPFSMHSVKGCSRCRHRRPHKICVPSGTLCETTSWPRASSRTFQRTCASGSVCTAAAQISAGSAIPSAGTLRLTETVCVATR